MSRAARCYDISALLAQGGNDMGRVKGDQRGSLVRIGRKYYGRFSKWVTAGNQTQWKAVGCGAAGGGAGEREVDVKHCLPCPFCGSENVGVEENNIWATCRSCGAEGPVAMKRGRLASAENAVKLWNQRALSMPKNCQAETAESEQPHV